MLLFKNCLNPIMLHIFFIFKMIKCISFSYTAHEVVKHSRGDNKGTGWQQANGSEASFDDISAFVIPIHKAVEASKLKPR